VIWIDLPMSMYRLDKLFSPRSVAVVERVNVGRLQIRKNSASTGTVEMSDGNMAIGDTPFVTLEGGRHKQDLSPYLGPRRVFFPAMTVPDP
jgi:hypothetical protein